MNLQKFENLIYFLTLSIYSGLNGLVFARFKEKLVFGRSDRVSL